MPFAVPKGLVEQSQILVYIHTQFCYCLFKRVVRKCYGRNAARTASCLFNGDASIFSKPILESHSEGTSNSLEIVRIRKLFLNLRVTKVASADTKWLIKND